MTKYDKVMKDQLQKGIIEKVDDTMTEGKKHIYFTMQFSRFKKQQRNFVLCIMDLQKQNQNKRI
jgi:predicted transcriptional regulator